MRKKSSDNPKTRRAANIPPSSWKKVFLHRTGKSSSPANWRAYSGSAPTARRATTLIEHWIGIQGRIFIAHKKHSLHKRVSQTVLYYVQPFRCNHIARLLCQRHRARACWFLQQNKTRKRNIPLLENRREKYPTLAFARNRIFWEKRDWRIVGSFVTVKG